MAEPITEQTFISSDAVKNALSNRTMHVYKKGKLVKVPIPESVRKSGKIPDGLVIDYCYHPATAVQALRSQNITMVDQLEELMWKELIETMNGTDNLEIIPGDLWVEKDRAIRAALEKNAKDAEEGRLDPTSEE